MTKQIKSYKKTHLRKIILLSLVLLVCTTVSNAVACPFCGFVIRTNSVVSSAPYTVIILLLGGYLLNRCPKLSQVGNIKTKIFVIGLSLIVGTFFYMFPGFRPFDVFPYEKMRQLSRVSSTLNNVCIYMLIIIITLPVLWLRVIRKDGWLYRFTLGLIGFAMPVFWLATILRYTDLELSHSDFLVRNIELGLIIYAILSAVPRLFPLLCEMLATFILIAFIFSGSFDTLSFTIISLVLISILITIAVLSHIKAHKVNDRLNLQKELRVSI